MACSGKQKRVLRAIGQKRDVDIAVGKAGLTETVVKEMSGALSRRELIKVRVPTSDQAAKRELIQKIADACEAELVGAVGGTALLYRPNESLDASARITFEE